MSETLNIEHGTLNMELETSSSAAMKHETLNLKHET